MITSLCHGRGNKILKLRHTIINNLKKIDEARRRGSPILFRENFDLVLFVHRLFLN